MPDRAISAAANPFAEWIAALEARQLADLSFQEVARALRALSADYVARRGRLAEGAALAGRGKRAAFALFYGPLHFLLVRHIAAALATGAQTDTLVDLGCGTGVAGAAWATACARPPVVFGSDRHPWAVDEARRTYRAFGLRGSARVQDITRGPLPPRSAVLAAFVVNELSEPTRPELLAKLRAHADRGGRLLVVEPIARSTTPWWTAWQNAFVDAGGRSDEWRVRVPLPLIVQKLDRAAGLDHRELTARSLWL